MGPNGQPQERLTAETSLDTTMEKDLLRNVLQDKIIVERRRVKSTEHLLVLVAGVLCAEVINHAPHTPLSGEDHAP